MKKIICFICFSVVTTILFAQGMVIYRNNGNSLNMLTAHVDSVSFVNETKTFTENLNDGSKMLDPNDLFKVDNSYIAGKRYDSNGNVFNLNTDGTSNYKEANMIYEYYPYRGIIVMYNSLKKPQYKLDVLKNTKDTLVINRGNSFETYTSTYNTYVDTTQIDNSVVAQDNSNGNSSFTDTTVSRIEMPHIDSRYDYICHKLTNGDVNYTIEYDKSLFQAVWVAYTYDSHSAQKNWSSRTDAWSGEPFYDNAQEYQVGTGYFPGYNRGHLVGSAERYYSQQANEQTFYMSNMSPMIGNFNSQYWGCIEDLVRDNWGRNVINSKSDFYGGTLYVVKGGALQPTTANPNPIMAYCTVKNTNGNEIQMAVPRYYYMAILFVSSTGVGKAIGFWVEHKDYNNTSESFLQEFRRSAACSIDDLEQKTGLDFFCNLLDNAEEFVESSYSISQWSGL